MDHSSVILCNPTEGPFWQPDNWDKLVINLPSEIFGTRFSKIGDCHMVVLKIHFIILNGIFGEYLTLVKSVMRNFEFMENIFMRDPRTQDSSDIPKVWNVECMITKVNCPALLLGKLHLRHCYATCTIFALPCQVSWNSLTCARTRYMALESHTFEFFVMQIGYNSHYNFDPTSFCKTARDLASRTLNTWERSLDERFIAALFEAGL